MTNNTASLFLPEEHRIISNWLDVEPQEDVPKDLHLEKALETLELDKEVWIHSTVEYAVAAILLERIQDALPQWASVSDNHVELGRNHRDRAAQRTVELTPQHLLTINWADSGPGYSWPEQYRVTYVPLYDVYVVTGSVDSTDVYGVTDFALGHFPSNKNVVKFGAAIVKDEWRSLFQTYDQSRWAYLFGVGLIDADLAAKLADQVWQEELEEDREDHLIAS